MRYFKQFWNESRGDKFDSWGCSWWYFETDDAGNVLRQIEKYDAGVVLRYDESHLEDEFGGLAEKPVDSDEIGGSNIAPQDFEQEWHSGDALNRKV
jgi:hypothetical protein